MIAALDWGGSWADAVIWRNNLVGMYSVPSRQTKAEELLRKALEKNHVALSDIDCIALTGGDARRVLDQKLLEKPVYIFDELECVAQGARFLSVKNKAVVVSCGTGTAVVYHDGTNTQHLGGSGVGGGTLEGLSRLLLGKNVEELEQLAKKTEKTLDLTVKDIVGKGIGVVPPDATASNFGNVNAHVEPEKIAKSLLYMVAETVATVASLASEKVRCDDLVFVGRVAQNKIFRQRLSSTAKIFGKHCFFPKLGEYATAIGAVLKASTQKDKIY